MVAPLSVRHSQTAAKAVGYRHHGIARTNVLMVAAPPLFFGSASRYVGLLASTMRRSVEGERHFEDAPAMNVPMRP